LQLLVLTISKSSCYFGIYKGSTDYLIIYLSLCNKNKSYGSIF